MAYLGSSKAANGRSSLLTHVTVQWCNRLEIFFKVMPKGGPRPNPLRYAIDFTHYPKLLSKNICTGMCAVLKFSFGIT